jgi:MurNAc alpha-1-phosphate uridylyltransferase
MILAAGRGERMRPLTDRLPKPLQPFHGKPLIQWQVERLAAAGFTRLVINHAWLGEQIEAFIGSGERWGVSVQWSREGTALGTAGGVATALPLLTEPAFLVVSADIYTAFDYGRLVDTLHEMGSDHLAAAKWSDPIPPAKWSDPFSPIAHLVLVDDPRHAPDFSLQEGRVIPVGQTGFTYGNMGIFRREFFAQTPPGQKAELGPLLHAAVARGAVTGEICTERWINVGTAQDLETLL